MRAVLDDVFDAPGEGFEAINIADWDGLFSFFSKENTMNMCGGCATGDCGWCAYYEEQKPSSSCVEIDVSRDLQEPHLLSRIIWQHLFNLYSQGGGDLSKLDSLLCDLQTIENLLVTYAGFTCGVGKIHVQWSFDPCGLTWINTQYFPESDFNYWIDWSGKRDDPIVIKRITHSD